MHVQRHVGLQRAGVRREVYCIQPGRPGLCMLRRATERGKRSKGRTPIKLLAAVDARRQASPTTPSAITITITGTGTGTRRHGGRAPRKLAPERRRRHRR